MLSTSENSLAAFMSTVLPIAENSPTLYTTNDHHSIQKGVSARKIGSTKLVKASAYELKVKSKNCWHFYSFNL